MANQVTSLSLEQLNITLELANLTSGAVGTTLNMLVDPSISVGNPQLSEYATVDALIAEALQDQAVLAVLHFQNGLNLPTAYILDTASAGAIADTMIGAPSGDASGNLTEIQLSAFGEAVSQMGSGTANNFSQFLNKTVDITPPQIATFTAQKLMELMPEAVLGPVILMTYEIGGGDTGSTLLKQIVPSEDLLAQLEAIYNTKPQDEAFGADTGSTMPDLNVNIGPSAGDAAAMSNPVAVQNVSFPSLDNHISASGGINKNLDLVMDVCLNLTVELGRTELSIKDVLELTRGSVIELSRIAGEPVDLYANGKMIAKGEVVVIEDNFGLRITSIVSPADRLRGL